MAKVKAKRKSVSSKGAAAQATLNATNKKVTNRKKPVAPCELELCLHAPGMDSLLRAGLGGLASVLEALDAKPKRVLLPGAPWKDNVPPWEVASDRILLKFGKPENAGEYLKRLFEFAFQIKSNENAIDLPSTYDRKQTSEVRAQLQQGLMLTFLQHGQSRKGAKTDEHRNFTIDDKQIQYSIRPLTSFKHQSGYLDLINKKNGALLTKTFDIPGTLFPGAAIRHNKFGVTKHEGTASELLAAYFALIGTMALPINRGSAVLLVPEVADLVSFGLNRQAITPTDYRDCLISGVGDAVLGVYARLKVPKFKRELEIPSVSAYLFRPTVWASQQKSRVAAARIEPLDPPQQKIFDYAAEYFMSQPKTHTVTVGRGKQAREETRTFLSHSIVKPLIADNLANRNPWFENFSFLFTGNDPATGKSLRSRLFFEKEGLFKMVNSDVWDAEGQKTLVAGVHYALFCQFGKISGEFGLNKGGMQNKFQKEFEKWRLLFVSAKTANQFRFALCDLMSRARGNEEIQDNWQSILPLISEQGWQHGRDLALLALASYKGKGDKEATDQVEEMVDEAT